MLEALSSGGERSILSISARRAPRAELRPPLPAKAHAEPRPPLTIQIHREPGPTLLSRGARRSHGAVSGASGAGFPRFDLRSPVSEHGPDVRPVRCRRPLRPGEPLVTTLHSSTLMVGVIEGIAGATAMIVKVFSGSLSDYFGRRQDRVSHDKLLATGLGVLVAADLVLAGGLHGTRGPARCLRRVLPGQRTGDAGR